MGTLFHQRGKDGYGFVVHGPSTARRASSWTLRDHRHAVARESTAASARTSPSRAPTRTAAPYVVTPGVPLNMFFDIETSPHFLNDAMSLSDDIRGGHVYAAFPFWSFLANHAGLPNLVGKMYGTDVVDAEHAGELRKLRALLHAEGLTSATSSRTVAHLRTTDFPTGAAYARCSRTFTRTTGRRGRRRPASSRAARAWTRRWTARTGGPAMLMTADDAQDCNWVAEDPEARCDAEGTGIFGTATLEDMQTTVTTGATEMVEGPRELRPGPFGWNAIKVEGVQGFVTVRVAWDALDTNDAENQWVEVNDIPTQRLPLRRALLLRAGRQSRERRRAHVLEDGRARSERDGGSCRRGRAHVS